MVAETAIYHTAMCSNCTWQKISLNEVLLERLAEEHMMKTGHVVIIKEVD